MPTYTYTGKNAKGAKVTGELRAESKVQLTQLLRKEQIVPQVIKEKVEVKKTVKGSVPAKDLGIFFKQFSVMIDAGLPLVQCLEIMGNNQDNKFFAHVINEVRTSVEGGGSLANSMRPFPTAFDDLMVNMIEAGEAGGILDTILVRLALYVEKAVKLKAAVKSALMYPVSIVGIRSEEHTSELQS